MGRAPEGVWAVGLFVLAAAYFASGMGLSFEWVDAGQIVYPSWRVAEGAVPYRDFGHLYGPSLFFFNGALLHLFGADLAVIRVALVLLKALVAALTYAGTRAVASRPFALMGFAVVVAVWGQPWWAFNTPYANHFALALMLAGLVAVLALPDRFRLACATMGVCCGLAATFKQTSGLFGLVAFALFLLWDPSPASGAAPGRVANACARIVRPLVLVGAAGLFALYLAPANTVWNLAALGSPIAVALALLARHELAGVVDAGGRVRSVRGLWWAGVGMAAPLGAYTAYFAARGAVGALVWNMMLGLPQKLRWFDPFPMPTPRAALTAATVAAALVALRWRRTAASSGRRRWRVAAFAAAAGAGAVAVDLIRDQGFRGTAWYAEVYRLLLLLPVVAVWLTVGVVFRKGAAARRPVALFYFFAAVSLLFLYPSGDLWHVLMSLPIFVPLLAYHLEHWVRVAPGPAPSRRGAGLAWAAALALVVVLSAPFVHALAVTRATQPAGPRLRRASGIVDASPKFRDAAAVLDDLAARPADRTLLVIANEQMFYFLADRDSVLPEHEFTLYLVGAGVIDAREASTLLSDRDLAARLAAARPLIVDYANAHARRFRATFPETARFIEAHYRPARVIGKYRILEWAG